MNWLHEQYANERYQEALREAAHDAELDALLETESDVKAENLRQAVGGKLIEWGKRLQETSGNPQVLKRA